MAMLVLTEARCDRGRRISKVRSRPYLFRMEPQSSLRPISSNTFVAYPVRAHGDRER